MPRGRHARVGAPSFAAPSTRRRASPPVSRRQRPSPSDGWKPAKGLLGRAAVGAVGRLRVVAVPIAMGARRRPPARLVHGIGLMPRVICGHICPRPLLPVHICSSSEDKSRRPLTWASPFLLQIEEGQVDLVVVDTAPGGTALRIMALADAEAPLLQVVDELAGVPDFVLLQAQPQRWSMCWSRPFSRADDALDAVPRETVVREVDLLDARALLAELSEPVGAAVVDLVLVELEDPELLAAEAEVQDHAKPRGGQQVLGEVELLVRVAAPLLQPLLQELLQVFIGEAPPCIA